ncbi:MAG: DUF2867 domain-containing protein [Segetibacter sp.]
MIILETNLPEFSIFNSNNKKYDYLDCFQGSLIDKENSLTPTDTCKAFLSSVPWWAKKLLALRNKIVSIFGLKVTGEFYTMQELDSFKYETGEQLGILKVFDRTRNEIVLGVDDKHLDLRVSLLLENSKIDKQKTLTISTIVEFNNWFGRLYFFTR